MLRTFLSGACGLAAIAVGLQLFSACYDVADQSYGNANGLSRSNLPGEAGAAAATCDTSTLHFDGGACPSFAHDVYPYMQGPWACVSGGCHGGSQVPKMDPESASATLASLQGTTVAGKIYIPSATTGAASGADLASSTSMLCNLQNICGNGMPLTPGAPLSASEQCLIQAWINCGAPQ